METSSTKSILIDPIGYVESEYEDPNDLAFACEDGLKTKTFSKIVLKKDYITGLKGLEEFSHLFVIYLLDRAKHIEITAYPDPPGIPDLPEVGVFASRSQYRPNHLALRLVKILNVNNNIIEVEGLDAINNSMVIDIKPYIPGFDRPDEIICASWYNWFDK